jgi:hypothetical protein
MRRTVFRSWLGSRAAVLGLVAALGCLAPTQVLASCGEYVTMAAGGMPIKHPRQDPIAPLRHYAPMIPANVDRQALDRRDLLPAAPCRPCSQDRSTPGPLPCQGPWCSRGQPQPMDLPATSAPKAREQQAVALPVPRLIEVEPLLQTGRHDRIARIHRIVPVYHPPRSL